MACELCDGDGGKLLWRDGACRVVLVAEPGYVGYCRVVWNTHVKELTDLGPSERAHLMRVVCETEGALRALLAPEKINLASIGNLTPHLHWHVIARFRDDPHFPNTTWGERLRTIQPSPAGDHAAAITQALAERLG